MHYVNYSITIIYETVFLENRLISSILWLWDQKIQLPERCTPMPSFGYELQHVNLDPGFQEYNNKLVIKL